MSTLSQALFSARPTGDQRLWPRLAVDAPAWQALAAGLGEGRGRFLGLWGEAAAVHLALLPEASAEPLVVTLDCPEGAYPSVAHHHPPASRLERTIFDLTGLTASASPDRRPWLDHGRWGLRHPLGAHPDPAESLPPYAFLPAEGRALHQIPVGPVHAGIIEPGHFRFTAAGETVVRLEERLGYVHKGIETLMAGKTPAEAAKLAARTSGDSTVAYSWAFARATEAALGVAVPERALLLRALMAELERLANHFGDIGGVCNDAAFALMLAHCGVLRERVLRAAAACFGHRLMMDAVVPGGVALADSPLDLSPVRALIDHAAKTFPPLVKLYDETASLQDRTVKTGIVKPALARLYHPGGYVGRASGLSFDTRREIPYAPYDRLKFEVPVLTQGDVNARVWIRIREVEQSLSLLGQILAALPPGGPLQVELPTVAEPREGLALVEGFRGDVLVWLRLDDQGKVARCHLRDPSWFQWPLLEAAIEGNIVADFPLCNKSFNCSYSGQDL